MRRTSSTAFCTASTPAGKSSEKYEFFKKFLKTTPALTPAQKKLAHSLRYEVFCHIPGFEDPEKFTNGLETDKYDAHAEHVLLYYKPLNRPLLPLGTIRAVFPNQDDLLHSFPLQDVMPDLFKKDKNKIERYCEFSRLCLSKTACKEALGDMSIRLSQLYGTSLYGRCREKGPANR